MALFGGNELVTVRARCRGLSLPLEYELHAWLTAGTHEVFLNEIKLWKISEN